MTTTTQKKPRTSRAKTATTKLPPNPFMNEILELVVKQKTKEEKIKVLKEYENDALKSLFIWNFDESVVSIIPEGEVPYTPNESPLGTDHSSLRREFKHFYNFVKGGNDTLPRLRRESIFIQILEGLHPSEAEIVCLVKDKRLTEKYNIPFEVVKEAYPDIKWGGRS